MTVSIILKDYQVNAESPEIQGYLYDDTTDILRWNISI